MKIINLFGGPGSGKSTTASGLFNLMKIRGHKVEITQEYAKELTYAKNWDALSDQRHVTSVQRNRISLLFNSGLDYIITDSPLLLGLIYISDSENLENDRQDFLSWYNSFDNINFFIKRTKPYSYYGRKETPEQAEKIDEKILDMLKEEKYDYTSILGDEDAHVLIYNILINKYSIKLNEASIIKKYEIIEVDRDYRTITDSFVMEFASETEAKEYCKKNSWTGYSYYAKEIKK